jgi:hypothetical protein
MRHRTRAHQHHLGFTSDLQAFNLHIPYIRSTKGDVEADVMLIELKRYYGEKYKAGMERLKAEEGIT